MVSSVVFVVASVAASVTVCVISGLLSEPDASFDHFDIF